MKVKNENFKICAKFEKGNIKDRFKVIIENDEIDGIISNGYEIRINIDNEEKKEAITIKVRLLLKDFQSEFSYLFNGIKN